MERWILRLETAEEEYKNLESLGETNEEGSPLEIKISPNCKFLHGNHIGNSRKPKNELVVQNNDSEITQTYLKERSGVDLKKVKEQVIQSNKTFETSTLPKGSRVSTTAKTNTQYIDIKALKSPKVLFGYPQEVVGDRISVDTDSNTSDMLEYQENVKDPNDDNQVKTNLKKSKVKTSIIRNGSSRSSRTSKGGVAYFESTPSRGERGDMTNKNSEHINFMPETFLTPVLEHRTPRNVNAKQFKRIDTNFNVQELLKKSEAFTKYLEKRKHNQQRTLRENEELHFQNSAINRSAVDG